MYSNATRRKIDTAKIEDRAIVALPSGSLLDMASRMTDCFGAICRLARSTVSLRNRKRIHQKFTKIVVDYTIISSKTLKVPTMS